MFPQNSIILIIVAAVICSVGFYKFVWFISVGYGLAVAGIGVAMLILGLMKQAVDLPIAILCILTAIYGIRLGGFLLYRELKSITYKNLKEVHVDNVPIFVKVVMWLTIAILYYCQTSPVWYRINNVGHGDPFTWLGIIVACAGILIEAIADKQKNESKIKNPNMPAMHGLFTISRCPNYFGEMVFWTGLFISGLTAIQGLQWIISLLGYVCIIYIMISGAKRLEKRHIKNYGNKPEYQAYANKTPILVPFIPIYHLVKDETK